ncbi:hypothetical protein CYMTET_31109 [Cymbomonas tetramitiformis]|uniref:Galactokinase N-terminal domain-containing protein n=1 Tax=Cymbomonas tetramitiformis TaxID=36881 RepID=A0AAE0KTI7_9CHLO|nr:hypothetical protein CYMTET_31109 [Cymbomonas tetramitiformis]
MPKHIFKAVAGVGLCAIAWRIVAKRVLWKRRDSPSWPSLSEIDAVKSALIEAYGADAAGVQVAAAPYRACPLGAHIDHQGGPVTAVALQLGVLLAFAPQDSPQVVITSRDFEGQVAFSLDAVPERRDGEVCGGANWGSYARGAAMALQQRGYQIRRGIVGVVQGSPGADGGGISSSAAVGVAFLLAFEKANDLAISAEENIELDRIQHTVSSGMASNLARWAQKLMRCRMLPCNLL